MKTNEISRITSISENLNSQQIEDELAFIVELTKQELAEPECILIMTALMDLSDQQWETYELLPHNLRDELDVAVMKLWSKNSVDSTEKLIAIIARLGLSKAYAQLIASNSEYLDFEVQGAIASAIGEFGNHINDPYSGMR